MVPVPISPPRKQVTLKYSTIPCDCYAIHSIKRLHDYVQRYTVLGNRYLTYVCTYMFIVDTLS